jgi:hypothetical protein
MYKRNCEPVNERIALTLHYRTSNSHRLAISARLILAELPGGGELRAMKQNAPNAIHNENLQQQLRRVPKQIVNPDS